MPVSHPAIARKNEIETIGLFLLVRYRLLRALSRSCVCLGLLSAYGKSFSVTDSPVAADFLKPLDIQSDLSS